MNPIAMMDKLLRDRESLYARAAQGEGLAGLCLRLLLIFVVTSALYGAAMGSYRWLHPDYYFSDYAPVAFTASAAGRVAGMNAAERKVYLADKPAPALAAAEVRFNVSRPTDPYKVVSVGEEKGYAFLALAPDSPLAESGAWALPLLVALKAPLLFLLSLLACCLVLYTLNIAFGIGLRFLPSMTLMAFALAATGVMLGVFIPVVVLFSVVTESYHFMKVLHVAVFAIAGLFGVTVLYGGLKRLAPAGIGGGKVRALLLSWLLLYGLVGGQLAWTLKPFLGTPYLPATPPFRIESGNIYVSVFESLSKLSR
jgi:hypothetical protein